MSDQETRIQEIRENTNAGLTKADEPALLDAQEIGVEWIVRDYTNELWGYDKKPRKRKTENGGFLYCHSLDNCDLGASPLDAATMLFIPRESKPISVSASLRKIERMSNKNETQKDGKKFYRYEPKGEHHD